MKFCLECRKLALLVFCVRVPAKPTLQLYGLPSGCCLMNRLQSEADYVFAQPNAM
jgi:hypothetical protein